eukprot:SAG11_NODE_16478_length_546_cov_1.029083_1_plen_43_part_01
MGGNQSRPPVAQVEDTTLAPEFMLDSGENIVASLRKLIPLVHA